MEPRVLFAMLCDVAEVLDQTPDDRTLAAVQARVTHALAMLDEIIDALAEAVIQSRQIPQAPWTPLEP